MWTLTKSVLSYCFHSPTSILWLLFFTTYAHDVILIIVLYFYMFYLVPCLFLLDQVVCCLFYLAHIWTLLSAILDNRGSCLLPCYVCSFPVYSRYNLFVCSVYCEVSIVEFMFFFICCDISFLLFYLLWNLLCCACFETIKLFLLLLFFHFTQNMLFTYHIRKHMQFYCYFPNNSGLNSWFWGAGELELYFKWPSSQQNLISHWRMCTVNVWYLPCWVLIILCLSVFLL